MLSPRPLWMYDESIEVLPSRISTTASWRIAARRPGPKSAVCVPISRCEKIELLFWCTNFSGATRAWCRVATGTGEGQMRRGAKGRNRLDDALGEAKEAHVALRYAAACHYAKIDEELLTRVDGVAAQLYVLSRRPRR